MEVIQVHADVGVVDSFVYFVLFLVDTEVLTLVAGVGLEVEQLFSVGDRCSEV